MLRNALSSGGVLALIKFYAREEEGHCLHRTPDVVDEFMLLAELYFGNQEQSPDSMYMARDITLINETVRAAVWIAYAAYH
ncbi:hypothetical protein AYX14_04309 [Cryptococcus neoformans]|nr:hypothetical protein AYX14_04309 [Cryptococcus neoformans var. grubii]